MYYPFNQQRTWLKTRENGAPLREMSKHIAQQLSVSSESDSENVIRLWLS